MVVVVAVKTEKEGKEQEEKMMKVLNNDGQCVGSKSKKRVKMKVIFLV